MKTIVLDKCYLRGASKKDVKALCDEHCVIMTDLLFMELLSNLSDRARCFSKFPEGPNPVTLLPSVSNLLQFEIENNRPCSPIIDRQYKVKYKFNPRMGEQDFVFLEEDRTNIEGWELETRDQLDDYREESILVDKFFPMIKGLYPGSGNEIIKETMHAIGSDSDMIREIYGAIRKDSFPLKSVINEHWAFFRWLQVHLLAAVDYFSRYGTISNPKKQAHFNDKLDLEYCIIGSLADGIASRDKCLIRRYKYICPSGIIIN